MFLILLAAAQNGEVRRGGHGGADRGWLGFRLRRAGLEQGLLQAGPSRSEESQELKDSVCLEPEVTFACIIEPPGAGVACL